MIHINTGYEFDFSSEKNALLKQQRGVCFDDIIYYIQNEGLIGTIEHPNQNKYPHQEMYLVAIENYVYVVPYILDDNKKKIFLKTVYPSRSATKAYLKDREATLCTS